MTTLAIIGTGTMGRRLAIDFARAGHDVTWYDASPAALVQARVWCTAIVAEWAQRGRITPAEGPAILARLHDASSLGDALRGATFIFENVPERLPLKREAFAAAAPLVEPDAVVVSNTSALPGSLMADATGCPERFVNANFGHLGHRTVEVMGHPGTHRSTRDRLVMFLRSCGFVPLVVEREQLGYSGNRVWRVVKREILRQLQEGVSTPADIDRGWMHAWHVEIGPCGLMDAIGLDVVADIEDTYAEVLGDASEGAPPFLREMVNRGATGVKSGRGFYTYPDPAFRRAGFLEGE